MVLGWPKMSIWTFPLFWNKHERVFLANPIFHWAILGVNWSYMSDFRGQLRWAEESRTACLSVHLA